MKFSAAVTFFFLQIVTNAIANEEFKESIVKDVKTGLKGSFKNGDIVTHSDSERPILGQTTDIDCVNDPSLWKCFRFSKVSFPNSYSPPQEFNLPLGINDFPIEGVVSEALKNSFCPTVIDRFDFFPRRSNIERLVQEVGIFPTHPSCDPNNPFWDEMREVIELAIARENNDNTCEIFEVPDIWSGYSLDEVAEAVHDEVKYWY